MAKEPILAELSQATKLGGRTLHAESPLLNDGTKMIGLASAASKLSISSGKFRRVVEQAGYTIYYGSIKTRCFIKISDFEELARLASHRRVADDRIRRDLGINVLVVPELVRKGAFGPEAAVRKAAGLNEGTYVYEEEFYAFKKRVDQKIKPSSRVDVSLTFGGFKSSYQIGSLTFADVVMAFLKGEVRATSGSSASVGQIRFARADLERLLKRREGAAVRRFRVFAARKQKAA